SARVEKGKLHYIVSDHQGTPREMLSEEGVLVWTQRLMTWGKAEKSQVIASNNPDYHVDCNFRFAGQYEDEESGLYYNRFRYYSPETAQYLSADPIGLLGGVNPYGYVHNPTGWIDPFGLTKAPVYENPGHHEPGYLPDRQVPFNSTKSVIPPNAEELFKHSQVDPNDPKTRWIKVGEGKKSVWHRFQSNAADGSGAFHWNGSTDGVDIRGKPRAIDTKNVPRFARNMEGIKGCKK
ncbi:RHS repeat-associated core domain-containing protein, partial [Xenorhabdus koppenhoeferi]|uniref:RHS repeat domain-containing protein n=1 Tax=Xenorhabdus koppenhoeferi TaxID=351659 RepID=UPI002B417120